MRPDHPSLRYKAQRISAAAVAVLAVLLAATQAQDQPGKLTKRYGYEFQAAVYPQGKPQETVQSVVQALEAGRIEYLLAHLADPSFVDARVAEYKPLYPGGDEAKTLLSFERLARETALHFREDPQLLKELRQFAKEADWELKDDEAIGGTKGAVRKVILRQLEGRWFLLNRQQ